MHGCLANEDASDELNGSYLQPTMDGMMYKRNARSFFWAFILGARL